MQMLKYQMTHFCHLLLIKSAYYNIILKTNKTSFKTAPITIQKPKSLIYILFFYCLSVSNANPRSINSCSRCEFSFHILWVTFLTDEIYSETIKIQKKTAPIRIQKSNTTFFIVYSVVFPFLDLTDRWIYLADMYCINLPNIISHLHNKLQTLLLV